LEQFDEQEFIQSHLATGEELAPERFPQLSTLSSAFFYSFVPVAREPEMPEVVFVPTFEDTRLETIGTIASWNFLWEALSTVRRPSRTSAERTKLQNWLVGSTRCRIPTPISSQKLRGSTTPTPHFFTCYPKRWWTGSGCHPSSDHSGLVMRLGGMRS
jgi:hypothetical protein